jgi:tRNA nucleotidyltransferase (CCA-adding enzyme)
MMHIILTHEQADFDALASLLGAYLLNEDATPVLPRRMNRNVQAFLTLYDADLPFVDPRDLVGEPIDGVTLVDTQSMVSVKGMVDHMKVHVIDHHPLRHDLPSDWVITISGTGANTTILVESIRESNVVLRTIHATLLLLGIYEDTGSLTYDRTTARDLRAASYLLEHGAQLQIATNFLNHPLSKGQQSLYDQLRNELEIHDINGYNIVIACGDATELDEELSTVAHKLRDLLDPDALFLLITTRGGVQLIARSTSDNIDVAAAAAHFGGGGHSRAAACLIKDKSLEDIYKALVELLPEQVHPAITVAQIMSLGPQLLSPGTRVEEAAERMQRFGHEGYPVVRGGQVIGLLTRRAVDRAMAHKLKLTVASLMEVGEYSVKPSDSIEHVQRLMTDTGWGQIPVVDPDRGEIIGIVTRTDLLKTLTPVPKLPSQQNITKRLELALPDERLALLQSVANAGYEQHAGVYIVGGFVRDLMMERPSLDFDLVVEGDAIKLARALAKKYGGRVTSHSRFGTAKWHLPEPDFVSTDVESGATQAIDFGELKTLDLVTARTEFYTHPTALPTVQRGSIKLDLHRRDFTINTLALRLDGRHYGELHDYWGGLADLRHGLVRVLHSLSFVDDPTRILRAVRFEQRFDFLIEDRTLELLEEAKPLINRVSGDRIRHELDYIIDEEQSDRMLARLDELSLLKAVHPKLHWDSWLSARLNTLQSTRPGREWSPLDEVDENQLKRNVVYILWLLRLSEVNSKKIEVRLKLSAELVKSIHIARLLWQELSTYVGSAPSEITKRLAEVPMLALYAIYIAISDKEVLSIVDMYLQTWRNVQPTISGHELRRRGLDPGPSYRLILESLRNAWLDGEVGSTDEEAALLDKLLK